MKFQVCDFRLPAVK